MSTRYGRSSCWQKDHGVPQIEVVTVGAQALADLGGQLPGGGEHQGADLGVLAGGAVQVLQHRQGEGGGLPGPGLSAPDHVAALERGGDGVGLDRGWVEVAALTHGAQQGRDQTQVVEGDAFCGRPFRPRRGGIVNGCYV
jgi:hypothetical protein